MNTQDEDTRDLRRLYAGLALMGDMSNWHDIKPTDVSDDDLRECARLYWRMADAMLATEEERS